MKASFTTRQADLTPHPMRFSRSINHYRTAGFVCSIAGAIVLCSALVMYSQQLPLSPTMESEAETISKCLRDLASDQPEVRNRAVLILGKYAHPSARNAVIQSLNDPEARIRLSALVSLTEKEIFPCDAAGEILAMLPDPDVHIRRIVSTYMPNIVQCLPMVGRGMDIGAAEPTPRSRFQSLILGGFSDEDATVRRNMAVNIRLLHGVVSLELQRRLLRDPDAQVRTLALDAVRSRLTDDALIAEVKFLAADPDPAVRRQLVQCVSIVSSANATDVLTDLAQDNEFDISCDALLSLFRRGGMKQFSELRRRLDDPRMDSGTAKRVISQLGAFAPESESAIVELMRHPKGAYRAMATAVYGVHLYPDADVALILELTRDSDLSVRQAAGNLLQRMPTISAEHIQTLTTNEYPDIRETAVMVTTKQPPPVARMALSDLALDDVASVRLAALQEFYRRKLDGWEGVIQQTIQDPDPAIRDAMIGYLLRFRSRDPGLEQLLTEFAQQTTDEQLRARIVGRQPRRPL